MKKKLTKVSTDVNDEIRHRLHRVGGQLQGIEEMIDQNRDCVLVLHQLMAARSALGKIAVRLLTEESCQDSNSGKDKRLELLLNELVKLQ